MRWHKINMFSQDNDTLLAVVNKILHSRVP